MTAQRIKILHAHSGNLYGGIETILESLAQAHRFFPPLESEFALCYEARLAGGLRALGSDPFMIGLVRASRPWTIRRGRKSLRRFLQQRRPDSLMVHSPWSLAMLGTTARSAGLPLILWLHGPVSGKHWVERWARRHPPDLIIANSQYTRATVPELFPAIQTEVLYAPIAAPSEVGRETTRERVRSEMGAEPGAVVLLLVARMEQGKGHHEMIDALAALGTGGTKWVCWVVGEPQQPDELTLAEELRARVTELGLSNHVRFLGERRDVPDLMVAADVYCQPGMRPESFGVTFIEALDAGLPVVTTALGGATEIVEPSCGVLLSPGALNQLPAILRGLIDSADSRRRLGANGPRRARELCDPERQLQRLSHLVATTIQRSSATVAKKSSGSQSLPG